MRASCWHTRLLSSGARHPDRAEEIAPILQSGSKKLRRLAAVRGAGVPFCVGQRAFYGRDFQAFSRDVLNRAPKPNPLIETGAVRALERVLDSGCGVRLHPCGRCWLKQPSRRARRGLDLSEAACLASQCQCGAAWGSGADRNPAVRIGF